LQIPKLKLINNQQSKQTTLDLFKIPTLTPRKDLTAFLNVKNYSLRSNLNSKYHSGYQQNWTIRLRARKSARLREGSKSSNLTKWENLA